MQEPEPPAGLLQRLPLDDAGAGLRYGIAAVALLVAFALRWLLDPYVGEAIPLATFFLATIVTSFVAGRGPAALSAIGGTLLAKWFFIAPLYSFAMPRSAQTVLVAYLLLSLVLIACIDMAQRARRRSEEAARTTRLLFHELQHRVSNNLQVIGALLSAQKRRVQDEAARAALDEAANRLAVVGRISRELYRADGGLTDMADFLRRMADAVLEASGRGDVACRFDIAPGLVLASDRAVPLALVFTEALSNALEHGLPDRAGLVRVAMQCSGDDRICLTVEDDGRGLAPGFSLDASPSLGLQIARQLARQLGGEFTLTSGSEGSGTQARLEIAA